MHNPFGALHHVCIVVPDIDAAIRFYESVGIGDWQDFPDLTRFTDLDVPDRDGFLALKYKYTDAPGVQIQLCEPGPGATPQRKFLERTGGGVFHVGFVVDNVDEATEEVEANGLKTWMYGRRPDRTGFTYFEIPAIAGVTLEIRQSLASELKPRSA
jgi:methylmalonyl-CoA/ethylmalonyl-CoA epimerase